MCGIVGIVAHGPVNQAIYDGLTVLQHRGQDAAGIITCDNGHLHLRKNTGLVRDVFHTRHMLRLYGNMGIGHVRYPTAGCEGSAEAQPFYVNSPYGISLAHNGNLTNTVTLKQELFQEDLRQINTDSDSEVLLNVLAHELQQFGKLRMDVDDVFNAVAGVHRRCRGAYAAVAMITGYGIVAFRDPLGIRPLVYGKRETPAGLEYMTASESVALDVLGFDLVSDVAPGEAVFFTLDGRIHSRQCAEKAEYSPCLFEYVYLSRPDSIIDDIDVVIPIPDTSRTSALQLANNLGLKYREGFIKNRYIGRTFIMPGQQQRKKSVRQKLNAIDLEFRGKNVLLVDDSIVRGTTSSQIIQMARDAGATKVYFASAAPPVRYPNVYGIDMPVSGELIAHGRTEEEVCRAIGADWLVYQDLADLVDAVKKGNPKIRQFDASVFTGDYITGDVSVDYLSGLQTERSDAAKKDRRRRHDDVMDLHNTA
jgi:amidophosphoribosyltransferase